MNRGADPRFSISDGQSGSCSRARRSEGLGLSLLIDFTHRMDFRILAAFFLIFFQSGPGLFAKGVLLTEGGMFSLDAPPRLDHAPLWRLLSAAEPRFRVLTGFSDADPPPVRIVFRSSLDRNPDLPSLRVDEVEGGTPRIVVTLAEGEEDSMKFRRLVAASLLLREYYGTKSPPSGSAVRKFPQWVIHGMGKLIGKQSGEILPVRYLHGGGSPTIDAFIVQKPPEDTDQTLVEAYDSMAGSLLGTALEENPGAFRSWVGRFDPEKKENPAPDFPPEWGDHRLERVWLLRMASLSSRQGRIHEADPGTSHKLLSLPDTIRSYDLILAQLPAEKDGTSGTFAGLRKDKGAAFVAKGLQEQLERLQFRANPMASPLLAATIRLCSGLTSLSPKKVLRTERELSLQRVAIIGRSRGIESYLDWYEAAREPGRSGLFDEFLATPPPAVKKGPVGRFVDAIESRDR